MPVWRLLRVHSGAPASRNDVTTRNSLLQRDADLQAGQVGTEAEVHAVTEGEVGVGIA